MTVGAAFACAFRRDLPRQTRNAIVKRTQNQTPAAAPLSTTATTATTAAQEEPKHVLEQDIAVSRTWFFWFQSYS